MTLRFVGVDPNIGRETVALRAAAFEAVWQRAVPHEKYTV